MKAKAFALIIAMTLFAALGIKAQTSAPTTQGQIITFDVPGSYGTLPTSINPTGEIAGNYYGPTGAGSHGFVRAADGTITTFDAGSYATYPASINPSGEIAGSYYNGDTTGYHAFLRAADGAITTFEAGSYTANPTSINPAGDVTGYYFAGGGPHGLLAHGFLRAADGALTTFDADPPIAGTYSLSINQTGETTGYFFDAANYIAHGFVRAADGTITTFDAAPGGTQPTSINPSGEIAGTAGGHGFVRKP